MENKLTVTDSVTIDATPSRVWDTLVNPSMTRKYMFDCEAVSDWKPGSGLIWKGATDGKVYVTGNVVEIENERLLMKFQTGTSVQLPGVAALICASMSLTRN